MIFSNDVLDGLRILFRVHLQHRDRIRRDFAREVGAQPAHLLGAGNNFIRLLDGICVIQGLACQDHRFAVRLNFLTPLI